MAGASLDLVDPVYRMQVHRIDSQTVEGVGRQGNYVTGVEAVDNDVDQGWFGFIGMNTENLSRQSLTPRLGDHSCIGNVAS